MADGGEALTLDDLHGETGIAHRLFRDGYHQDAVRKAAQRYVNRVAELAADDPGSRDRQGVDLINRVFSEDSPVLAFNPRLSLTERDDHNGYRFLGTGLTLAIRNVMTHTDDRGLTPAEAFEWLAFISAMHRRLDNVQQVAPQADTSAPNPDAETTEAS